MITIIIFSLTYSGYLSCCPSSPCLRFLTLLNPCRSPGGTPVRRRRSKGGPAPLGDPAALIAEALKRKFAHRLHDVSSDKENSLESPFGSPETPKVCLSEAAFSSRWRPWFGAPVQSVSHFMNATTSFPGSSEQQTQSRASAALIFACSPPPGRPTTTANYRFSFH